VVDVREVDAVAQDGGVVMIWRSAEYRLHVVGYVCPVCGGKSEAAAHIGGISAKGTGIKPADWVCVGMCDTDHKRLDGTPPPLKQRERERVLKACILELGEFLEQRVDGDEPDHTKPKRKIRRKKKAKKPEAAGICTECRAPSGHRLTCSRR
jgi:hypothetical protein